mmetsp:Transcript_34083/g.98976  ORF Transcript_34083/g.98976 Transcript_34083/m.98976 type:complete len:203 (-) Transcript_34083:328-936(-)
MLVIIAERPVVARPHQVVVVQPRVLVVVDRSGDQASHQGQGVIACGARRDLPAHAAKLQDGVGDVQHRGGVRPVVVRVRVIAALDGVQEFHTPVALQTEALHQAERVKQKSAEHHQRPVPSVLGQRQGVELPAFQRLLQDRRHLRPPHQGVNIATRDAATLAALGGAFRGASAAVGSGPPAPGVVALLLVVDHRHLEAAGAL